MRLEPLVTEGIQIAAEPRASCRANNGHEKTSMFTIRLSTRRPVWQNAVALSWSAAGKEPTKVTLRADGQKWTFAVKGRKLTLDWTTGKIE